MKYVAWFFGVVFILNGITEIANYPLAAVICAVIGVIVLPPVFVKLPFPKWTLYLALVAGWTAFATTKPEIRDSNQVVATQTPTEIARQDSIEQINKANKKIADDLQMAPYKARRAVKNNLKDPDSFDEIDTKAAYINDKGIYIQCLVRYRANNSFGGKVIEQALVNLDETLQPIDIQPL